MAVAIPTYSAASTQISLVSSAIDQKPFLGGRVQRVARLGDRWSYTVDLRPVHAGQSRPLLTRLLQCLSDEALCPVIISGVDLTGQTDATATSGAGKSMTVTGDLTGKVEGQFFSLVKNGVRYLHMVTSITGQTVFFQPALKVTITGGEVLEFAAPKIQGFIEGNEQGWTTGMVANVGLTFKIVESR